MSIWANPLYGRWRSMIDRCQNPQNTSWKDYGGRGITVCDRWRDFAAFEEDILRDLGPCPPGLTMDRINNDGGYCPGNVRWATRSQQALNRRPRLCEAPAGADRPESVLASRMYRAMRDAGIRPRVMANYLGVSRQSVTNWTGSRITPDTRTLRLWALRTGVSYGWLTGEPAEAAS